jgi:hypothetical protein
VAHCGRVIDRGMAYDEIVAEPKTRKRAGVY